MNYFVKIVIKKYKKNLEKHLKCKKLAKNINKN